MPERVDPLAGLGVVTTPAYKDITVGVIASENTKKSYQFGRESLQWAPASFDLEGFFDKFSDIFRRNFKAAVKLERIEDAKMVQIDMIAVLDIYDTAVGAQVKTEASVILF
ncbi:MAG: hypothetical protein FP829_02835, partial [Nitrospirae bacterium]|nr:hypothetical protein [Nitrospirota bacterium]